MKNNIVVICVSILIFLSSCTSEYHYQRGVYYNDVKNFDKAKIEFKKAINIDTNNLEAYWLLGHIEYKGKNYYRAIYYYNKYIDKNNNEYTAFFNRAQCRAKIENFIGSLNDWTMGIKLKPGEGRAYYERGRIKMLNLIDQKGAETDFDSAIVNKYINPDVYICRGTAKLKQNNINEALDDYLFAIDIDSTYLLGYFNVAALYETYVATSEVNGNNQDAYKCNIAGVTLLDKAIRNIPKNKDLFIKRGNFKGHLNDTEGALSDYKNALNLDPNDIDLLCRIGVIKIVNGDKQDGIADVNKSASLGSKRAKEFLNEYGEQ